MNKDFKNIYCDGTIFVKTKRANQFLALVLINMLFELWVQMFQMWREQVVFAGYLQSKDINMFGMQRARSHNGLVYLRILQQKDAVWVWRTCSDDNW